MSVKATSKYPVLIADQVAVVIADGATGHILNHKLELYKNDTDDAIYRVFDNSVSAKEFINQQSFSNDKLEFIIYDKNQVILEYIEATHWDKKI
ncbi:hypothetical protein [Flavobacterium sp.]|uniref:hypothetical protein n=1 Tax=Flavobacterium sp. TaxID=239 RepID=UPI0039E617C1